MWNLSRSTFCELRMKTETGNIWQGISQMRAGAMDLWALLPGMISAWFILPFILMLIVLILNLEIKKTVKTSISK